MKFNPIARWTLGPSTPLGMETIQESIYQFKKIYPEFDRVVCYNNIDKPNIKDAELFKQNKNQIRYPIHSSDSSEKRLGSGWKLCPPRLRLPSHELWIDNDIVIWERLKEIDDWLNASYNIVSHGLHQVYGCFQDHVPEGTSICAGFFGIMPYFDLEEEICSRCERILQGAPLGGYDEQGLVATIITSSNHKIIPLETVFISEISSSLPTPIPPALHFVGVNRHNFHKGWKEYKSFQRLRSIP